MKECLEKKTAVRVMLHYAQVFQRFVTYLLYILGACGSIVG
jgi:hypothetical protein